ncbi:MAG: phosphodiester glycosidase family protein [Bacteroidetes bacterium]|nr:phosphodiester glycosidase family protein [Bacteroidota bacterium]
MRKLHLLFLPIALLCTIIAGNSYGQSLDTLSAAELAPGVEHYSIVLRSFPLTINVVKVNLSERGVSLRVVKASKDAMETLDARAKTSEMMEEANTDSTQAIAAINGGFFDIVNGCPMDLQIENGMIGKLPEVTPIRSSFLYGASRKAVIGCFDLSIELATRDTTFHIDDLNEVCRHDQTILFDRFYRKRTGSNLYGVGVILRPLSNPEAGAATNCVVDTLIKLSGDYAIPADGFVLVARGAAGATIGEMITDHDTVQLITKFTPKLSRITQALAGWPGIVRNGKNVAESEAESEGTIPGFAGKRHPRTSIGVSRDGTEVLLVVVDGRTKKSIGVTLPELADLMMKFGAYDAVNMDGGGSSTMAIEGKVVNAPSDAAGERPVSDALVVTVAK